MLLTTEQKDIQATARAFAEKEIAPHARAWEEAGGAPRALYEKMASVGLMGVMIDQRYGGAGADFVSYALALEEISAADGGISNMMAANNSPVALAIETHGTDRHKHEYLTKLTSGEWMGCIHLTEPHTGSDASAITTRAVLDGDEYVLNGQKAFITAGSTAAVAMIVAVPDPEAGKRGIPTFITPTANPGNRLTPNERKL